MRSKLRSSLPMIDQAFVSGMNFVIGLALARLLGLEQFGYFTLLWMVVLFAQDVHHSLVTSPMLSLRPHKTGAALASYDGALMRHHVRVTALLGLIAWVGLELTTRMAPQEVIAGSTPALLASLICLRKSHEFFRRFHFAGGRPDKAFFLDALAYAALLLMLLYGAYGNAPLSLHAILVSYTLAFACSTALGLFLHPRTASNGPSLWKEHWRFGQWLLYTNLAQWGSKHYLLLMVGAALGPAALGGVRAAQNLAGLFNILFLSLDHWLPMKAGRVMKGGGWDGLKRYMLKAGGVFLAAMLPLSLALLLKASFWMEIVFGAEYKEFAPILQGLALISLLQAANHLLSQTLRALHHPRALFFSYLLGCLVVLPATPFLLEAYLAGGYLLGLAMLHLVLCFSYLRFILQGAKKRG